MEGEEYKPFSMTLKALFVENLNSNGKRFETNPDILVNVTLIDGSESALTQNIIRTEALSDCLQLVESKGNDMSIEQCVLSGVLKVAWGRGIAQIWYRTIVILLLLSVFNRQRRQNVELLNCAEQCTHQMHNTKSNNNQKPNFQIGCQNENPNTDFQFHC